MNSSTTSLAKEYLHFMRDVHLIERGVKPAVAVQFINLIEQYGIRWVGLTVNNVEYPVFAGNELSLAKGLDGRNAFQQFVDDARLNRASSQTPVITRLSGRGVSFSGAAILKGDALRVFKQDYREMWGESLGGRSNKLLVCDWSLAFHFLTQGHTEAAKDFAELGADAIADTVKEEINNQQPALTPERELQRMLIAAASYSEIKLVQETSYIQIDPTDPKGYVSRHIDLLEKDSWAN